MNAAPPRVTTSNAGGGSRHTGMFFFPDCRGWAVNGGSAETGTWEMSPEPRRAGTGARTGAGTGARLAPDLNPLGSPGSAPAGGSPPCPGGCV